MRKIANARIHENIGEKWNIFLKARVKCNGLKWRETSAHWRTNKQTINKGKSLTHKMIFKVGVFLPLLRTITITPILLLLRNAYISIFHWEYLVSWTIRTSEWLVLRVALLFKWLWLWMNNYERVWEEAGRWEEDEEKHTEWGIETIKKVEQRKMEWNEEKGNNE